MRTISEKEIIKISEGVILIKYSEGKFDLLGKSISNGKHWSLAFDLTKRVEIEGNVNGFVIVV